MTLALCGGVSGEKYKERDREEREEERHLCHTNTHYTCSIQMGGLSRQQREREIRQAGKQVSRQEHTGEPRRTYLSIHPSLPL